MPVFHVIAVGPAGSGKSEVIRHFSRNLPEGYRLKSCTAPIPPSAYGQEYWTITVEKLRKKKGKST